MFFMGDESISVAILTALLFRLGEQVTLTREEIEEARNYTFEMIRNTSYQDDTITLQVEEVKPVPYTPSWNDPNLIWKSRSGG